MNTMWKSARWVLLPTLLLLQACGDDEGSKTYTVRFSPQVRQEALTCEGLYTDIGTSRSTIELLDFEMFVRDVTLVRANGERHPLKLEQDGTWQRDNIALLDFEDGTGTCRTGGTAATRREVVGSAPEHDDYTRLEFKVGLAPERNHLDYQVETAPLDNRDMWWGWQMGYKFVKLDVRTPANAAYVFHLGAVGCKGSVGEGYTCASDSQATIALDDFSPEKNQVVLDVAGLFSELDVNRVPNGTSDMMAGCMSNAGDPECPALYSQFGLAPDGSPKALPKTFFRVR
ncbi:MbnP family copper-binding protein [Myxococcus landrumensis]|uniref:Metallo-mystery pair system four-Cys motif protein n=1 Tax=Myxococcus landrumensis TaxID=2813577 RepID=A0ABX7N4C3_9BACT|nr:MbnP family copper-binding protein [Myxococcus landrumus]QSQ12439.1 metallo-mystery pair system four-Cys motif protein [Myxococcus landrumus]